MQPFIVHSIPGSPYGRAVLLTLEEKGLAYQLSPVAPGDFQRPVHLARHPFGRVPVLDHGDFRLFETQAILRYLDRIAPEPSLTPADPQRAGRMDQMMNITDWYLFQGVCSTIAFQRVVAPRVLGMTPDEAVITAALPRGQAVFNQLARQLGEQTFFAGEALSLADLLLAPQIDLFHETPEWEALTGAHDNLRVWLDRMNARPGMMATTWDRVAALAKAA